MCWQPYLEKMDDDEGDGVRSRAVSASTEPGGPPRTRRVPSATTNSPLAMRNSRSTDDVSSPPRLHLGDAKPSAFAEPSSDSPSANRVHGTRVVEYGKKASVRAAVVFTLIALALLVLLRQSHHLSGGGRGGAARMIRAGADAVWRAQTLPKKHCRARIPEDAVRSRNVSLKLLKQVHAPQHPLLEDDDEEEEEEGHARAGGVRLVPAVAIIVPLRQQYTEMVKLMWALHPMLQCQGIKYWVYVVEQAADDDGPYDINKLRNAGAEEAMKEYLWDCIAFHDVDVVPLDARCPYSCKSRPTILAQNSNPSDAPFSSSSIALISRRQFFAIDGFAMGRWSTAAAPRATAAAALPAPFNNAAMAKRLASRGALRILTPPSEGFCAFTSTESTASRERRQRRAKGDDASSTASSGGASAGVKGLVYAVRDTVHHALFTRWRFAFGAAAIAQAAKKTTTTTTTTTTTAMARHASTKDVQGGHFAIAPAKRVTQDKATKAMAKILRLRNVRTGAELEGMSPNEVRDTLKVEAIENLHDSEHAHLDMWDVTDIDLLFLANKLGVAWEQSEERWGV